MDEVGGWELSPPRSVFSSQFAACLLAGLIDCCTTKGLGATRTGNAKLPTSTGSCCVWLYSVCMYVCMYYVCKCLCRQYQTQHHIDRTN